MNSVSAEVVERARRRLLKLHLDSGASHLGGNLSCLEAILCLYHGVLQSQDTFVLSKGHAVGTQYVALWSAGFLTDEELDRFMADGTHLPGHPPTAGLPFSPFATGSLGHGLSLAAGVAKGNKLAGKPGRVYCLTSDGEWQEGQSWEALTFALTHKLGNLTILVDHNGLQGFARTQEVDCADLVEKLRGFGADVGLVDGHDRDCLMEALKHGEEERLRVFVLETIKGRGIPELENQLRSHYAQLDEASYHRALSGERR